VHEDITIERLLHTVRAAKDQKKKAEREYHR